MKRTATEIMDLFEQVANEAAMKCNESYKELCLREQIEGVGEVQVLRYENLLSYAEGKFGGVLLSK